MNELVLLESRTARQDRLTDLDDNYSLETINKAKALLMAMWKGQNIATTAQMAEYYEVPEATVQTVIKRNREELTSDGLKTLKGNQLVGLSMMDKPHGDVTVLTIWTPRAALRLGMLLRDSLVAQKVRTLLLDVAEQQITRTEFTQLAATVSQLVGKNKPSLSLPRASVDPIPGEIAPMTERALCNRLVREYVFNQTTSQPLNEQDTWRWQYRELKYRHKYDINARFDKTKYKSKLDQIEADGYLPQLLAICNHFLGQ